MATLNIHQWAFPPGWQHSREETQQHTQQSQEAAASRYNFTASSLPDITVGKTKLWDIYIWTSHIHRSPQAIPHTHSKGKDVGTEPSFSSQACSWIHTSRIDGEWSPITSPDIEWSHWGTTAHTDPTQGATTNAEEVNWWRQVCLQLLEDPS